MKSTLVAIGGADISCLSRGCKFPTPLDDVWAIDVAPPDEQARPASDRVAEFDGNDVVQVYFAN
jgi:hypothetical protein